MDPVDCSDLPNPTTPLAFLPPDVATELEVSRYIYVATLGVCLLSLFFSFVIRLTSWQAFTWDLFSNVPADYKLLFEQRITTATVVYFASR